MYECPHKLFDIFLKSYCKKCICYAVKDGNYTALNLLVNTYFNFLLQKTFYFFRAVKAQNYTKIFSLVKRYFDYFLN